MKKPALLAFAAAFVIIAAPAAAQDGIAPAAAAPAAANPFAPVALGEGPWDLQTEKGPIHVEVLSNQLERPWGMAFTPDGSILITERPGRLRVMNADGKLDPTPITGLPPVYAVGIAGLMDIVLHPDFANNRLLYISYSKPDPADKQNSTMGLMRARWDGGYELTAVEEIFVANTWYGKAPVAPKCCGQGPVFGSYGGRMVFDQAGKLLLASGDRNYGEMVADPANHFGKILRFNDDGTAAADNPFVGQEGWSPEIWTTGHRNPTGLTVDPQTGEIWSSEFGPRGGDEVNKITRGANYGWMDVTQGHHYDGTPAKGIKDVEGMTDPVIVWGPPSANPGNLSVYRGTAFPQWDGNLLVAMMNKTLVREEIDASGNRVHEEVLLKDLGQRLRDVRVGPDGNLYILTDENAGAMLKVSPGK